MCGIYCQFNDNLAIDVIKNGISHRGPDSFSHLKFGNLDFVHSRLSILELSDLGNQPMKTEDGRFILIYNGEIYNHLEIRKNKLPDISFKSTCDTETLLIGLSKYGADFIKELNGIFSFVLYDTILDKLLISRDQIGVKPLYIYENSNKFFISSELKAFINKVQPQTLDLNAISNYLTYLWSLKEQTPLSNVRRVKPGEIIEIDLKEDDYKLSSTCSLPESINLNSFKTEEEYLNKLNILLKNAVEYQLLSDVPVGFFLSGGLDSSLLLSLAKEIYPDRKFNCYTIDTQDLDKTEGFVSDLEYARKVANQFDCPLIEIKADKSLLNDFDKMIWHLDEPQADPAPLLVNAICKAAKKDGVKVLIGGTGGDDIFSGYRRHQSLYYEQKLRFLPTGFLIFALKTLSIVPFPKSFNRRVSKFLKNILLSSNERLDDKFKWLNTSEVNKLFLKSKQSLIEENKINLLDILNDLKEPKGELDKLLYLEQKTFLVNHNLNYTDKSSMAEGVEVRVPYLDNRVVSFANALPEKFKMKGTVTKYILRKLAERYLPKEIIYRSKTGFGGPVRKWINEDFEYMISKRLSRDEIIKRGIFDPSAVWNLINRNKKGEIDAAYSIWSLLAIDPWMRQFIDGEELYLKN
jgi:asparagine synthase (glutamine-hydrolysing)